MTQQLYNINLFYFSMSLCAYTMIKYFSLKMCLLEFGDFIIQ